MVVTTGGPLRYILEAPSILASNLDLDKVNYETDFDYCCLIRRPAAGARRRHRQDRDGTPRDAPSSSRGG